MATEAIFLNWPLSSGVCDWSPDCITDTGTGHSQRIPCVQLQIRLHLQWNNVENGLLADSTLCACNNKNLTFRKIAKWICLAKFLKKKKDFCLVLQTAPLPPLRDSHFIKWFFPWFVSCLLYSASPHPLFSFNALFYISLSITVQHFVSKSSHELAEIAHCEEKSCYEKPVSTKETEESWNVIEIKGQSLWGTSPWSFSLEVLEGAASFNPKPLGAALLNRLPRIPSLNLAFYPNVQKLRLSWISARGFVWSHLSYYLPGLCEKLVAWGWYRRFKDINTHTLFVKTLVHIFPITINCQIVKRKTYFTFISEHIGETTSTCSRGIL